MHGSHRLFFRAACRPGDSRDTHTQRAAHAPADALRQRHGHFRADRSLRRNNFLRHIHPRGLQFVAVTDYATQKIGRASSDAGQPLRQQSAGATLGGGNCCVIHGQFMRDNFFERAAIFAENAICQRNLEAPHDFVQRFLRMRGIIAPQPQMNLRFARSRKNSGLHLAITLVNVADTLLDIRFAKPGDAELAMIQTHARSTAL